MCLEARTGSKATLPATAPETQDSPRDSKLLSSLGTSAGLPSEIPVPHHSRSPSGSPLLSQGFRRFSGFLLLLMLLLLRLRLPRFVKYTKLLIG